MIYVCSRLQINYNTYIVSSFQASIISDVFTQCNFSFHLAEKLEITEIQLYFMIANFS